MSIFFEKSLRRLANALPSSRLPGIVQAIQSNFLDKQAPAPGAPMRPRERAPILNHGASALDGLRFGAGVGARRGVPDPVDTLPDMLAGQFGAEAGTRPYKLFVPPALPSRPALIVMLHGCTQNAADFAAGTRMNVHAMREGFLVLYPEQVHSANLQNCWNWFVAANQHRGTGEPSLIAGMTRAVMAAHGIDPGRVFVAGLSAGGAKAAVLGMTYPDLFKAIGVHSGLACGAAHDLPSAIAAMRTGTAGSGKLAVPTIVFHGELDRTVNPSNSGYVAAQANQSPPLRVETGVSEGGLNYTRVIRAASRVEPALEEWRVQGLGHAWSGGDTAGSFTDPRGPDATAAMLAFFKAKH